MLGESLSAASMDPLAYGLAYLMGNPVASLAYAAILSLPNYACAAVAVLPSRVLYRLGRRLREARELGSYQLVETGQVLHWRTRCEDKSA